MTINTDHAVGPVSYNWSTGDTISNSISSNALFKDSVFVLTATDSIGCQSIDSVSVKLWELPAVSLGPDVDLCSEDIEKLIPTYTLNDSSSHFSFAWYNASSQTIISRDSSFLVSDSGQYICEIVNSFGCVGADTIDVQKMNLQASSYPQTICKGDSCKLSVNINSSDHTIFQWFLFENQNLIPIGTGQSILVKPLVKSFYVVKTIKSKFGFQCSEYDTVSVDVLDNPEINIAGDQTFCHSYSPVSLKQFVSPKNGYWTNSKQELVQSIIPNNYAPGIHYYYYHLVDSQTQCSSKDSIRFEYLALPEITTSTSTNSLTFCDNQTSVSLNASPLGGVWIGLGVNDKQWSYYRVRLLFGYGWDWELTISCAVLVLAQGQTISFTITRIPTYAKIQIHFL